MASSLNIVLVHGAWADGSSWSSVIPTLQQAGHKVIAAQLPLTSLSDDVNRVRKLLECIQGPTILVGHSYGCAVITGAGTGVNHVVGLVFVAGFALDEGESLADVFAKYPALESGQHIKPDANGFLWVEPKYYHKYFAADISPEKGEILGAVQNPIAGQGFTEKSGPPAWRQLPSWYQVSENDMMIPPDAQRMMAKRANATTISLPSSHASMISHWKEISDLILQAAKANSNIN